MTTPIGLALLFLMAIAPALPWRTTSNEVLQRRLLVPAWVGAITMLLAAVLGAHGVTDVIAFGLAAFALAGIVRQFAVGIAARRRAHVERRVDVLPRLVRSNPRLYGGLVVHTGIVLIALALAASSTYSTKREVRLARGASAVVAGYRVTYLGREVSTTDQKRVVKARVRIEHGDDDLGVYAPSVNIFPGSANAIGTPSVRTGLREDVYLTLVSAPSGDAAGRVTIGVAVNPMVVWLWIGGGVVVLGTLLALVPGPRRRRVVPEPAVEAREREPVPA
jgi:cytochrome c-type biogenesis protein CcmF